MPGSIPQAHVLKHFVLSEQADGIYDGGGFQVVLPYPNPIFSGPDIKQNRAPLPAFEARDKNASFFERPKCYRKMSITSSCDLFCTFLWEKGRKCNIEIKTERETVKL